MGTAPDRDYQKPRDAADFLAVAADIFWALVVVAAGWGTTVAVLSLEVAS